MRQFEKPRIFISKCLGQASCRYDGAMITSDVVEGLAPFVEYITTCPEMEIGLPVPREALRIVRNQESQDRLVLLHVFGYFKRDLTSDEKSFFLENLELYNQKRIPFSVLLSILKSWIVRFDYPYLKGQTLFEPFPAKLFQVTDSGKGI